MNKYPKNIFLQILQSTVIKNVHFAIGCLQRQISNSTSNSRFALESICIPCQR
jgi:hypothetical protein